MRSTEGNRGIVLFFLELGMRGRRAPAALLPENKPVTIELEAVWALGPVLTGTENLTFTWVWTLSLPTRNELLYRLRDRSRISGS
jgi:hypothetical protein